LEAAIQEFRERYWPCTFKGGKNNQPCVNSYSGHASKGHQNAAGKPIGEGAHVFGLDIDRFGHEWILRVKDHVQRLYEKLKTTKLNSTDGTEIFKEELRAAYSACTNVKELFSHGTCLSCLMEVPSNALPCGHIICSSCVSVFGEAQSETATILESCPLHRDLFVQRRWRIAKKPDHAGVRILTLDG
jgi:hypothetical protein